MHRCLSTHYTFLVTATTTRILLLNFICAFFRSLFLNMLCQLALSGIKSVSLEGISLIFFKAVMAPFLLFVVCLSIMSTTENGKNGRKLFAEQECNNKTIFCVKMNKHRDINKLLNRNITGDKSKWHSANNGVVCGCDVSMILRQPSVPLAAPTATTSCTPGRHLATDPTTTSFPLAVRNRCRRCSSSKLARMTDASYVSLLSYPSQTASLYCCCLYCTVPV